MKKLIVPICVLLLCTTVVGQTRRRSTKRGPSAASKAAAEEAAIAAVRNKGANTVANQIRNLTTFLYLLGGVAKGIEAIDASAKTGPASPTNEKNKAQLRASFGDFRAGLDALETYFRSTPELQPFYTKLAGSAAGAATAESQANAGRFDQAGRTLLGVVGRLADVLVAMP
jgi:hypothetical protein